MTPQRRLLKSARSRLPLSCQRLVTRPRHRALPPIRPQATRTPAPRRWPPPPCRPSRRARVPPTQLAATLTTRRPATRPATRLGRVRTALRRQAAPGLVAHRPAIRQPSSPARVPASPRRTARPDRRCGPAKSQPPGGSATPQQAPSGRTMDLVQRPRHRPHRLAPLRTASRQRPNSPAGWWQVSRRQARPQTPSQPT